MPIKPTLHRPYRVRERKSWDKGLTHQDRLTGRALQARNKRIKMRDKFTCQNKQCNLVTTELEVDHRISVAAGGSDSDTNVRCLCEQCHSIKSRIESQGKQLPDPDNYPVRYDQAKRLVAHRDPSQYLIDDVDDECSCDIDVIRHASLGGDL